MAKKPKKVKPPKVKRLSPMQIFDKLTGEIKTLMASKPELEGLEDRLGQLFIANGLKPNRKGIKDIVEDYRKKQETTEAPEEA